MASFYTFAAIVCALYFLQPADANYDWARWTNWSSCNATCDGTKYRTRECMRHDANVSVSHGTHTYARYCGESHHTTSGISSSRSTVQYDSHACSGSCPVVRPQRQSSRSYHWGEWTSWTHCNATCEGTQYQIRACRHRVVTQNTTTDNAVAITYCDVLKTGNYDYKRRACGPSCSVNVWSTWSDWSACSSTCDDGTRYRGRHCLSGDNCVGTVFDQQVCNLATCLHPVDGGWGEWQQWGACSTSCGLGYNVRYRSCTHPAPKDGGADCTGKRDQVRVCPLVNCPIDGGWGDYTTHSCTVTCGVGLLFSVRKCDNPPPQFGGKSCAGGSTVFDKCVNPVCNIDGDWTEWSNYTDCEVVCGTGHMRRTRTCTNPVPQANGTDCVGEPVQLQECDNGQCPTDIKTCDKTKIQQLSPQPLSSTSLPTSCDVNSQISVGGFGFVESYCSVPSDRSKWRLGIKIHNNCEMIPLYTPVGSSDNGVHVKEVGVMADCFQNTLEMMTQSCNTDIVMKSFNLTDVATNIHMILFEN